MTKSSREVRHRLKRPEIGPKSLRNCITSQYPGKTIAGADPNLPIKLGSPLRLTNPSIPFETLVPNPFPLTIPGAPGSNFWAFTTNDLATSPASTYAPTRATDVPIPLIGCRIADDAHTALGPTVELKLRIRLHMKVIRFIHAVEPRKASQPASAKSSRVNSFSAAGESLSRLWSYSEVVMVERASIVVPTLLGCGVGEGDLGSVVDLVDRYDILNVC